MKKSLLISIAIPLIVGFASGFLSGNNMMSFSQLNKPPLSPPGWLFPIVWTILYILMGISFYLIVNQKNSMDISSAVYIYFIQLIINFFWSIFFFRFEWYLFSFLWLVLLWMSLLLMIILFYRISPLSAYIQIPYLFWVTFAGYLNLSIYLLNA